MTKKGIFCGIVFVFVFFVVLGHFNRKPEANEPPKEQVDSRFTEAENAYINHPDRSAFERKQGWSEKEVQGYRRLLIVFNKVTKEQKHKEQEEERKQEEERELANDAISRLTPKENAEVRRLWKTMPEYAIQDAYRKWIKNRQSK